MLWLYRQALNGVGALSSNETELVYPSGWGSDSDSADARWLRLFEQTEQERQDSDRNTYEEHGLSNGCGPVQQPGESENRRDQRYNDTIRSTF